MPRRNGTKAKQAYDAARGNIALQLKEIKELLIAHDPGTDYDYGHVGDLAKVGMDLKLIVNFLKNEEEDEG